MNKKVRVIIIVEFIIILLMGIVCFESRQNIKKMEVGLDQWKSQYITLDENGWYLPADQLVFEGYKIDLLYGPYIELNKGYYTVQIEYECESSQSMVLSALNGNDKYIKANEFWLEKNINSVTYDFNIASKIDNFEAIVRYNGQGEVRINSISIYKNNNGEKLFWLLIVSLICLGDALLYFCDVDNSKKREIASVIGITIIASLPLFCKGLNGHDLMFHLMRIEGLAVELKNGHFPIGVASLWHGGYGYPTSFFYGDVLLYFPAFLRICGLDVNMAYKVFVFFVNLISTTIAMVCFNKIWENKKIGAITTLVYMTASYKLVDIYIRAAIGEYCAFMFFPIVAYAIWSIYQDSEEKSDWKNILLLAVGMGGIVTTHILSTEMMVTAIILTCIINIKRTIRQKVLLDFFLAAIITCLLAAYFIIPFMDYYFNVPVIVSTHASRGLSAEIQSEGIRFADFFDFFRNPFGGSGSMLCTSGVILIGTYVIAIIVCIKGRDSDKVKLLTIMSTIMMIISTRLFPWDMLAKNYRIFNVLAQVQFPWRFVGFVILFQALLFGSMLSDGCLDKWFNMKYHVLYIGIIMIVVFMTGLFMNYYSKDSNSEMYYDTYNLDIYGNSSGDYLRTNGDVSNLVYIDDSKLTGELVGENVVELEMVSRRGTDMDIKCKTSENAARIELPLINYKGYQVVDDNGSHYTVFDSERLYVSFELPAEFDGIIHVKFIRTWYWNLALIISLISWCIVIVYLAKRRYVCENGALK
nr:hypothetical protein [uncultured Butyrivibrio sp.]